ncbi:hypothetical protein T440DRAFT_463709 [Plenodomus tracheiphilus IPT5]|uniref:Uncharacterized protein n=1 Tax=Plenodomus tracheiphilus IPT5 TaxID=1408161 RepID=A0A6A7BLV0_9PLEO|nr:hypothetical protein T440DRAFT_463709 [Plenodomus tracheiphilus IPT5]
MLPDATFIQDTEDPVQTTEAFVTDVQIPTQGIEDPTQSSEDFIFPGPTSPPTAPPPGSYTSSNGLGTRKYFIGAYLPTLVAILLSIWWKCIFHRIKEMEPFYQMARPGGAKAEDSLLLRYHGATLPGVFFSSIWSRHLLAFLGSLNMALITLCTLLASETMYLDSEGTMRCPG